MDEQQKAVEQFRLECLREALFFLKGDKEVTDTEIVRTAKKFAKFVTE